MTCPTDYLQSVGWKVFWSHTPHGMTFVILWLQLKGFLDFQGIVVRPRMETGLQLAASGER